VCGEEGEPHVHHWNHGSMGTEYTF
jgi:hypothetical protein